MVKRLGSEPRYFFADSNSVSEILNEQGVPTNHHDFYKKYILDNLKGTFFVSPEEMKESILNYVPKTASLSLRKKFAIPRPQVTKKELKRLYIQEAKGLYDEELEDEIISKFIDTFEKLKKNYTEASDPETLTYVEDEEVAEYMRKNIEEIPLLINILQRAKTFQEKMIAIDTVINTMHAGGRYGEYLIQGVYIGSQDPFFDELSNLKISNKLNFRKTAEPETMQENFYEPGKSDEWSKGPKKPRQRLPFYNYPDEQGNIINIDPNYSNPMEYESTPGPHPQGPGIFGSLNMRKKAQSVEYILEKLNKFKITNLGDIRLFIYDIASKVDVSEHLINGLILDNMKRFPSSFIENWKVYVTDEYGLGTFTEKLAHEKIGEVLGEWYRSFYKEPVENLVKDLKLEEFGVPWVKVPFSSLLQKYTEDEIWDIARGKKTDVSKEEIEQAKEVISRGIVANRLSMRKEAQNKLTTKDIKRFYDLERKGLLTDEFVDDVISKLLYGIQEATKEALGEWYRSFYKEAVENLESAYSFPLSQKIIAVDQIIHLYHMDAMSHIMDESEDPKKVDKVLNDLFHGYQVTLDYARLLIKDFKSEGEIPTAENIKWNLEDSGYFNEKINKRVVKELLESNEIQQEKEAPNLNMRKIAQIDPNDLNIGIELLLKYFDESVTLDYDKRKEVIDKIFEDLETPQNIKNDINEELKKGNYEGVIEKYKNYFRSYPEIAEKLCGRDIEWLLDLYTSSEFHSELPGTFEPLKRGRKIGSFEDVLDLETAKKYSKILEDEFEYSTEIIEGTHGIVVVFWRGFSPEAQKALELYKIYETAEDDINPKKLQGLTLEEHNFLGKMFGISKKEREWFIKDISEDIQKEETDKLSMRKFGIDPLNQEEILQPDLFSPSLEFMENLRFKKEKSKEEQEGKYNAFKKPFELKREKGLKETIRKNIEEQFIIPQQLKLRFEKIAQEIEPFKIEVKVTKEELKRLYKQEAKGLYDEELMDEIISKFINAFEKMIDWEERKIKSGEFDYVGQYKDLQKNLITENKLIKILEKALTFEQKMIAIDQVINTAHITGDYGDYLIEDYDLSFFNELSNLKVSSLNLKRIAQTEFKSGDEVEFNTTRYFGATRKSPGGVLKGKGIIKGKDEEGLYNIEIKEVTNVADDLKNVFKPGFVAPFAEDELKIKEPEKEPKKEPIKVKEPKKEPIKVKEPKEVPKEIPTPIEEPRFTIEEEELKEKIPTEEEPEVAFEPTPTILGEPKEKIEEKAEKPFWQQLVDEVWKEYTKPRTLKKPFGNKGLVMRKKAVVTPSELKTVYELELQYRELEQKYDEGTLTDKEISQFHQIENKLNDLTDKVVRDLMFFFEDYFEWYKGIDPKNIRKEEGELQVIEEMKQRLEELNSAFDINSKMIVIDNTINMMHVDFPIIWHLKMDYDEYLDRTSEEGLTLEKSKKVDEGWSNLITFLQEQGKLKLAPKLTQKLKVVKKLSMRKQAQQNLTPEEEIFVKDFVKQFEHLHNAEEIYENLFNEKPFILNLTKHLEEDLKVFSDRSVFIALAICDQLKEDFGMLTSLRFGGKPKYKGPIISILEDIAQDVWKALDLTEAKNIVLDRVEKSQIAEEDKQTIITNVNRINNLLALQKYIANSILAYEGMGTKLSIRKEAGIESHEYKCKEIHENKIPTYTFIGFQEVGDEKIIMVNCDICQSTLLLSPEEAKTHEYQIEGLPHGWEKEIKLSSLQLRKKAETFIYDEPVSNEGSWAIYKGNVYITYSPGKRHPNWFEEIGLPSAGEVFDKIVRGYFYDYAFGSKDFKPEEKRIVWYGMGDYNEFYDHLEELKNALNFPPDAMVQMLDYTTQGITTLAMRKFQKGQILKLKNTPEVYEYILEQVKEYGKFEENNLEELWYIDDISEDPLMLNISTLEQGRFCSWIEPEMVEEIKLRLKEKEASTLITKTFNYLRKLFSVPNPIFEQLDYPHSWPRKKKKDKTAQDISDPNKLSIQELKQFYKLERKGLLTDEFVDNVITKLIYGMEQEKIRIWNDPDISEDLPDISEDLPKIYREGYEDEMNDFIHEMEIVLTKSLSEKIIAIDQIIHRAHLTYSLGWFQGDFKEIYNTIESIGEKDPIEGLNLRMEKLASTVSEPTPDEPLQGQQGEHPEGTTYFQGKDKWLERQPDQGFDIKFPGKVKINRDPWLWGDNPVSEQTMTASLNMRKKFAIYFPRPLVTKQDLIRLYTQEAKGLYNEELEDAIISKFIETLEKYKQYFEQTFQKISPPQYAKNYIKDFANFINILQQATTPEEKMIVIDQVLNAVHGHGKYGEILIQGVESEYDPFFEELSNLKVSSLNLKRKASILDYPQKHLDPEMWDLSGDLPKLKEDVKNLIIKRFIDYLKKERLNNPELWCKGFYYTGSTATYRYLKTSDIDIHVEVDWDIYKENNPNKVKDDNEEMRKDLLKVFWNTLNKEKLPGTSHPLTYYILSAKESVLTQGEEAYDMINDKWIVSPQKMPENLDTEEKIKLLSDKAEGIMKKLDEELGKTKRNLIDYKILQELISSYEGDKEDLQKLIEKKLEDIEQGLKQLQKENEQIHEERNKAFYDGQEPIEKGLSKNWTPGNILFKLIERYRYLDILRKIKHIIKDDQVTETETKELEDVLIPKLSMRKIAQLDKQLFFDFYGVSLLSDQYLESNLYAKEYKDMVVNNLKEIYIPAITKIIFTEILAFFRYLKEWKKKFNVKKTKDLTLEQLKQIFYEGDWGGEGAGGKLWGQITDSLIQLKNTSDTNQLITIIDHINDLVHYGGSVVADIPGVETWFFDVMDIKAEASPQQLISYLSSDLQKLVIEDLKLREEETIAKEKYLTFDDKEELAEDPNTSPDILTKLFNEEDAWDILIDLARNISTPYKILIELSENEDKDIQREALKTLKKLKIQSFDLSMRKTSFLTDNVSEIPENWVSQDKTDNKKLRRTNPPRHDKNDSIVEHNLDPHIDLASLSLRKKAFEGQPKEYHSPSLLLREDYGTPGFSSEPAQAEVGDTANDDPWAETNKLRKRKVIREQTPSDFNIPFGYEGEEVRQT